MTFERQMDETRGATAQITCWCTLIALHQEFGVGADRLNRIQDDLEKIQDLYSGKLAESGSKAADKWLCGQINDRGPLDFRVPVLRAPRKRKEQQLRMAGDSAASIAWRMYELAVIRVLGYGKTRLTRLLDESRKNYAQVNGWAKEGGMEYAFSQICKCAKLALREDLEVIDSTVEGWDEYAADFDARRKMANRVKMSEALAKPAQHTDREKEEIFERCLSEVAGSARQVAMKWRI